MGHTPKKGGGPSEKLVQQQEACNTHVGEVTAVQARQVALKWTDDNADKVCQLAVYLMSGGFKGVVGKQKAPGHMPCGTSSLHDLAKHWLRDLLLQVESSFPNTPA